MNDTQVFEKAQLQSSSEYDCPVYIPALLKDRAIGLVSAEWSVTKQGDGAVDSSIVLDYLYKFFAGDRNMQRGFADASVIDMHLWWHGRMASSVYVKQVCNSTRRFQQALQQINQARHINVALLIQVNRLLRPRKNNYGLRRHSIRAGDPRTNPHAFTCLPAELIEVYLHDLIDYIHQVPHNLDKALMVYWQFIAIHPFRDGNGRVARLLFLHLMQHCSDKVAAALLMLYLKSINRRGYIAALDQYRQGQLTVLKVFYQQALRWANSSHKLLVDGLIDCHKISEHAGLADDQQRLVVKATEGGLVNKDVFQLKAIKAGQHIYINLPLMSHLNHFDYYLRAQLRQHKKT